MDNVSPHNARKRTREIISLLSSSPFPPSTGKRIRFQHANPSSPSVASRVSPEIETATLGDVSVEPRQPIEPPASVFVLTSDSLASPQYLPTPDCTKKGDPLANWSPKTNFRTPSRTYRATGGLFAHRDSSPHIHSTLLSSDPFYSSPRFHKLSWGIQKMPSDTGEVARVASGGQSKIRGEFEELGSGPTDRSNSTEQMPPSPPEASNSSPILRAHRGDSSTPKCLIGDEGNSNDRFLSTTTTGHGSEHTGIRSSVLQERGNKPPKRTQKVTKKGQDRKITVKSMICDIHTVDGRDVSKLVGTLDELGVTVRTSNMPNRVSGDGIEIMLSLSRQVRDRYDPELDAFVSIPECVEKEETTLVVLEPVRFSTLLLGTIECQEAYFSHMNATVGGEVIFLVQGLDSIVKKRLKEFNKEVQSRTKAYLKNRDLQLSPLKRPMDHALLSAGQVQVQLRCRARVIYSQNDEYTAEWIANLVQDISLARYSRYRSHVFASRSKAATDDTSLDTLMTLSWITPQAAKRAQAKYRNVATMMYAMLQEDESLPGVEVLKGTMAKNLSNFFRESDPNKII